MTRKQSVTERKEEILGRYLIDDWDSLDPQQRRHLIDKHNARVDAADREDIRALNGSSKGPGSGEEDRPMRRPHSFTRAEMNNALDIELKVREVLEAAQVR